MAFYIIKNFIQLTIFFNLLIIDKKLNLYPSRIHPFYLPYKKPILFIDESKIETLKKGRNYLDKCLNFSNNQIYNILIILK